MADDVLIARIKPINTTVLRTNEICGLKKQVTPVAKLGLFMGIQELRIRPGIGFKAVAVKIPDLFESG